jgi:hypothetical protein
VPTIFTGLPEEYEGLWIASHAHLEDEASSDDPKHPRRTLSRVMAREAPTRRADDPPEADCLP